MTDFSEALTALKAGKRVRRAGWGERPYLKGAYAELYQLPVPYEPQVMVIWPGQVPRPFSGAQWDILAEDWEVLD